MVDLRKPFRHLSRRTKIAGSAVALIALGAAGGAGAMSMTRPGIEMAPAVPTAIARLSQTSGIVTVKGKVADVYGNRFIVQDGSGRALVDAGSDGARHLQSGGTVMIQGRYDEGQVRASYLVDSEGHVEAVGPPPGPPHGPLPVGPIGPGRDGAPTRTQTPLLPPQGTVLPPSAANAVPPPPPPPAPDGQVIRFGAEPVPPSPVASPVVNR